jgi:hypothetical protein
MNQGRVIFLEGTSDNRACNATTTLAPIESVQKHPFNNPEGQPDPECVVR